MSTLTILEAASPPLVVGGEPMGAIGGIGSVFKRGDSKFWWIRLSVQGREVRESTKCLRKSGANELLLKRIQEYRLAPGMTVKSTVAEIFDEYIRDCEVRGVRRPHQTAYRAETIKKLLGHQLATDIDPRRIRELQQWLAKIGYGNGTINTIVGVLKTALRLAALDGRIPHVPQFPRRMNPPPPRQGFLEVSDVDAISAKLEDWARDIFSFAYLTGWRRNEILTLEWTEVDLPVRTIRLNPERSKNRESRQFPILGELHELMLRRWNDRRVGLPWVFHRGGAQATNGAYGWAFRRATKAAGLEGKTTHDARRTVARDLERARVPRGVAMKLLGHKTQSIYERYSIAAEDELEGGVERLNEYREAAGKGAKRKVLGFAKKEVDS